MKRTAGFSMVELLVAVAIAGVLLGVGVVVFRPGHNAVNQAARVLAGAVTEARFEAVKSNRTAHFVVSTSGDGGYGICVDENEDGSCTSSEYKKQVEFGTGDFARATLSATNLTDNRVRFDSRGVPLDAVAGKTMTVTERGGTYAKTVVLSSTGRTEVR
jgi:type IV fimbrial biogenesis protein FimT